MRRDIGTIIIGLLFLAAGVAIGGSMLGYFDFRINFAGWWTLFLIIPALLAISQGGINAGNIILLGVGVILLLNAQGVIPEGFSWKLVLPVVLLAVGFQLIFGNIFYNSGYRRNRRDGCCDPDDAYDRDREAAEGDAKGSAGAGEGRTDDGSSRRTGGFYTESTKSGRSFKTAAAFLGGQNIIYQEEDFTGGAYTAVMGGLTINLRSVRLVGDVVINCTAIMGGIDLIVPDNVRIVSNVIPVLGGVENKYPSSRDPAAPTIIVNGNTVMGGITIK